MMPFWRRAHRLRSKDGYIGLSKVARVAEVLLEECRILSLAREIAEAVGEVNALVLSRLRNHAIRTKKDDANLASSRIVSRHGIGC